MAAPRGIANNNPGNIKLTPAIWTGEVPKNENTDGTFKQFTTMNLGIQALIKNLLAYFKNGNNTISKIIDKWDFSQSGDSDYKQYVSKSTGYGVYKLLSPDKEHLVKLSRAIIDFENGTNNITTSNIEKAYDSIPKSRLMVKSTTKGDVSTIVASLAIITGIIIYEDYGN